MPDIDGLKRDLVTANHILARENLVDAYGHVSARHPGRPDRYLLSCSRAPELVALDDILEFRLEGDAIDAKGRKLYLERFIHGAIYEARPDVHSVIHNHSLDVVPFAVTTAKLRPLMHTTAVIGADVPVWDAQHDFGDTSLLITDMAMGRSLAKGLGAARTALMRGHGAVAVGRSVQEAVYVAYYLQVNARLQQSAGALGEITFLSKGEIAATLPLILGDNSLGRAWEYWRRRAGG
jgi:ribulose-5-phosphate 4-epimerase/fuculose-1-phosphate aldolase